jgi:hypothetical protein
LRAEHGAAPPAPSAARRRVTGNPWFRRGRCSGQRWTRCGPPLSL